ncbi:metalloregulator ArsR/SmtB family transcription factor [Brevundimonas bullata]|jgi:DNA-binding transcriptional ArsR family regulator|uniref:ArsR/SmtB family transcription factor n=1 Tax=Brevundimonas bullata TaxID=13160 RepID=UPI000E0B1871|nr:metalloregulator ArsR/SmtB family transcription factor [Brevundimonas bullata]WQE37243.1 metalloregulator ArsR/SmtB family transcription factor [Brevundimonas bullata]
MNLALQALSEPHRMAIVAMLADGERPAGDFVDALPISQPTVSKHLSVLREAGLVTVRKDAQRRLYRLNPAPLAELDAWLQPYRRFWVDRLDALESHLDKEFPQ